MLNVYTDSACTELDDWFAIQPYTGKIIPSGTFTTTSNGDSCSVTFTNAFGSATVSSGGGCTSFPYRDAGASSGMYAQISSCPPESGAPTAAPNTAAPVAWAGKYKVQSGCSTTSCCCLAGTVTVTQSDLSVSFSGSVTGQCDGSTSYSGSATLSSASATTASFTLLGQQFTATRSGDMISVENIAYPQCSGSAVCTGGACSSSSSSSGSVASSTPSALLALALMALLSSLGHARLTVACGLLALLVTVNHVDAHVIRWHHL